jgi:hypothetical protein
LQVATTTLTTITAIAQAAIVALTVKVKECIEAAALIAVCTLQESAVCCEEVIWQLLRQPTEPEAIALALWAQLKRSHLVRKALSQGGLVSELLTVSIHHQDLQAPHLPINCLL